MGTLFSPWRTSLLIGLSGLLLVTMLPTTPVRADTGQYSVNIDSSLSNGLIEVEIEGAPPELFVTIKNNSGAFPGAGGLWQAISYETIGNVTVEPLSLFGEFGILAPDSWNHYSVHVEGQGAVTFSSDITSDRVKIYYAFQNFFRLFPGLNVIVGETPELIIELAATFDDLREVIESFVQAFSPELGFRERVGRAWNGAKGIVDLLSTEDNLTELSLFIWDRIGPRLANIGISNEGMLLSVLKKGIRLKDIGEVLLSSTQMIAYSLSGTVAGSTIIEIFEKPENDITPGLSVSPESGITGTRFEAKWTDFSPSHNLAQHLRRKGGTEQEIVVVTTNGQGKATSSIDSRILSPSTYELWGVDNKSGIKSNVVEFTVSGEVDLSAYIISLLPSSVAPAESFSVTVAVKNHGNSSSGAFSTWIYASTSPYGTGNLLTKIPFESIGPGNSQTVSVNVVVPSSLSSGEYYITAYADAPGNGVVNESREDNNIGSSIPNRLTSIASSKHPDINELQERVVQLAYGQIGNTQGDGDFAGLEWADNKYTYCDRFVSAVVTVALGKPLTERIRYETAILDFEAHNHLIRQGDPPRGTLVYYDKAESNSYMGHVGIYDGFGNLISVVNINDGVLSRPLNSMHATILGWIYPSDYYLMKKVTDVTLTLYVHENSASGPIISGAEVTGQDGGGNSFSQTTNSSGYVTITGVPGTWSFDAFKSGYETNSWPQSVTSTETRHAFVVKHVISNAQGIDVSHWQGSIVWSTVGDAGCDFAFVKATEGVGWTDSNLGVNMNGANGAGILVGPYHFARPDLGNDAQEEALYFIRVADEYIKEGYLRPVLDLEEGASLGKQSLSNWVHDWMNTVKQKTGVEPILYISSDYAKNYLDSSVTQYDLWIAHWTYNLEAIPNTGIWDNWTFWQYSNRGLVTGIQGNVDLNLFVGSRSELNNFTIRTTTKKPNPPTLLSPGSSSEPGPVLSALTPTLQWNAISGAGYYALVISKYPYGSGNIVYNHQQLTGTSYTVPNGILEARQKYRWSMQAHNSSGWSDVSSSLHFQTAVANVTMTLYVHENSASGPVIVGAEVTGQDGGDNNFSQTTNSNGYVTITGVPGTWSFTAYKSGYDENSWSQSITATDTKHAYLTKGDVTLTLYVHENSTSGPIISGAEVTGQDGADNSFGQTTNSDGYVTITGVPGTWSFTAYKSGYDENSWSQSITATTTKHAYLQTATPSSPTLVDVGIAATPWPPQTYLQARPGDTIYTLYTFSYFGPNILVNLKTTILDANDNEIGNQVTGSGFQIINPFENPIRGVGVEYKLSDDAISGTYNVKFSIWNEDNTQQYDSVLKSGWLEIASGDITLTLYVHENSASGPIISGVEVTGQDGGGNSFSQVTNSSGYVTITGTPGTWSFTALKSGYNTNSWSQSITATTTKHAYLTKGDVTLTLYVHENSTSGPIISGAEVTGQDGGDNSFSQTTNSDGYVTITGVPGIWSFDAYKSGYDDNSWSQSITATDTKHAYLVKTTQKPNPPTPMSPGSGSDPGPTLSTLTPTLQWNAVSGADYYALAISKYPYGSSNIIYNPQQLTGTSHTVPGGTMVAGEKYRWNMQAHNSAGWSAVSNILYFQTPTPTVTYTLTVNLQGQGTVSLSPSGGSYASGTQVTLTATPSSGWRFSGWSGDLSGSQNPATITMNSNQSITSTFAQQATPPSAPTITSPGSGSEPGPALSTLTPTLQWNAVSGADYYALAISKYPYGSSNIIYNPQQLTGTSHTVPGGTMVAGEKYRWNMQAHNSAGWSDVSNILYFQTAVPNVTLTLYVHENSASGPVIIGAQVTGQDEEGNSFNKTTNPNGYVTITGAPGIWSFTASKIGYDTNSWSQSITANDTKHAYLIKQVVSPQITGVSPSQPTAQPTRQWMTILGNGFIAESQVTLRIGGSTYVIPADRTQFLSSSQIKIYVGLTEANIWTAQVTNPGGYQSNIFSFQVVP